MPRITYIGDTGLDMIAKARIATEILAAVHCVKIEEYTHRDQCPEWRKDDWQACVRCFDEHLTRQAAKETEVWKMSERDIKRGREKLEDTRRYNYNLDVAREERTMIFSNKTFHEAACDLHDALWELFEASGLLGLCERVLDWIGKKVRSE